MIILVLGIKTLEEYLKDINVVEVPDECNDCGRGLWRNGYYKRKVLSLREDSEEIWIPRLWCPDCRISFSCLFEFLIPYKQYILPVLWRYTEQILEGKSLRETAWSEEDGDREDAEASVSRVYRAVDDACKLVDKAIQKMHEKLQKEGVKLEELRSRIEKFSVKSEEKQKKLNLLAYANRLYKRFWGDAETGLLLFWSRVSGRYGKSNLGYRLSAPQTLKQQPF